MSLSVIDDNDIFRFLFSLNKSWRSVSHTAFTTKYLPAVAKSVKQYIITQLRDRQVTLVLDEMRNSCGSYINFVIAVDGRSESGTELYFWKCMKSEGSTSAQISSQMCDVVQELEQVNIYCSTYSTDNCNAMRGTEDLASLLCGRKLVRIPCTSHILNNILKDFINKNVFIKDIWDNVFSVLVNNILG